MTESFDQRMRRLLMPDSIAFVGGAVAEMCIRRCIEMGYDGHIWPVHPTRETVAGYPCFSSVSELPSVPDAAYVGVNRELTIDVVRELSAMGAGGCVCYAAGFAEIGGDGEEMQCALKESAGEMPVVGPNTFGLINHARRCALWPYLFGGRQVDRGPALISQSGNIAMNLTMNKRSVGFTYVIGAGNQAVLGPGHYIDAMLEDDSVSAIGMYIEGFDDIGHFCRAASAALDKGVPIVVVKAGKTEASARQTSSHTSALTGADELYDAFFARLGVIRVDSLNRLLETLKVLDQANDIRGRNIFTLSCSGGEAALIADAAPEFGLELPAFDDRQVMELNAQFPEWVTVSNPFDYNTSIWGDREGLERCFTSAMQGPHDAAFLVYDHPTVDSPPEVAEWVAALDAFIAAAKTSDKAAFVICTVSELLPDELRDYVLDKGVIPLQGLEDGLYAYAAAAKWHANRRALHGRVVAPSPPTAEPNVAKALDEWQSKGALKAYGLRLPAGATAGKSELTAAGNDIGYPVVLKALGSDLLHKSDVGGVAVNLQDENELLQAAGRMEETLAAHGLTSDRFLVEKMVEGSVAELIVGVKRDAQFGLALVIGTGGILVELVGDACSLLLPVSRHEVRAAIDSLSVSRLLQGFRGAQAGSTEAAVDAVMAVADYAEAHRDSLLELDVNPLMITADSAIAADALIVTGDSAEK